MDDFERYGDYNEVDVAPKKRPVLKAIKYIAIFLIFAIIGFLVFRIFTINYYPDTMESFHFTDALKSHYAEKGGNIKVESVKLRAPYDDEKEGNFFADYVLICREAGTLQVTLRYNVSIADEFESSYGCKVDVENRDIFTFSLMTHVNGSSDKEFSSIGRLVYKDWDSFLMYRYVKLVFEDVDFAALDALDDKGTEETEDDEAISRWLALDIHVDGVQYKDSKTKEMVDKEFKILVYDNLGEQTKLSEYELSSEEVPQ